MRGPAGNSTTAANILMSDEARIMRIGVGVCGGAGVETRVAVKLKGLKDFADMLASSEQCAVRIGIILGK